MTALDGVLDVFRLRQYFDVLVRSRDLVREIRTDAGFVDLVRRALLPLPFDRRPAVATTPFGRHHQVELPELTGTRIGVVATGGSGALASVVGVGRALEEAGLEPSVISVCSGSALFGFPLAAGVPATEVAEFVLSLQSADYVDVDWRKLAALVPTGGRGFAGLLAGDRLERAYRRLLGDRTLGRLPVPAYAPVWNVERNCTEFLGPRTHPDLPVARAVHMAVALPLFFDPVLLDRRWWCDGGIVDIFPVGPVLDIEEPPELVLAVNGFYPPGFAGEDATGWRERRLSILDVASQVRTSQQAQLAREHLARLRAATEVHLLEPVPYDVVKGAGFYRQFLEHGAWPGFMEAGRAAAAAALREAAVSRRRRSAGTATAGPARRAPSRRPADAARSRARSRPGWPTAAGR